MGKVSTSEQREEVLTVARQAEEWLEEANSLTTTVKEYNEKYKSINVKAEPIFYRYSELTARPAAIKKLQGVLSQLREKIGTWTEKLPQITEKETEGMLEAIQKVDSWIEKKEEEQKTKPSHEEPAFESSEVPIQLKPVQTLFEKLIRKPKPPPEKVILHKLIVEYLLLVDSRLINLLIYLLLDRSR